MLEISLFHGIRITMNFNDRVPPHFHAQYAEYNVQIDIIRAIGIRGFSLPGNLNSCWRGVNSIVMN